MQNYVSRVLYHLTGSSAPEDHDGNFLTLCKVLDSMELRPRAVDGNRGGIIVKIDLGRAPSNGEYIEQNVTCFCDIPFNQLYPLHTSKYGMFGVGVDRTLVAQWGGRPVVYVPTVSSDTSVRNNGLGKEVLAIWNSLDQQFLQQLPAEITRTRYMGTHIDDPEEAVDAACSLLSRDLLAFIKLFEVDLDDTDPCNYYMEREWRKFGPFPLHMSLREVVVHEDYVESIKGRYPQLRELVRSLPSN